MHRAGSILRVFLTTALLAGFTPWTTARGAEAHPGLERDVLPLLKAHCLKCHGPIKPKGKLNLSSARSLARGGASGAVVVPGNPDESTLWDLVANDEMPPEPDEPLSDDEKNTLRRWIEEGARNLPSVVEVNRTAPGSDHWAFAPSSSPPPPSVTDGRLVRTPVDRFIQKTLEDQKLCPRPEADRATLIRRVSFDLTGLPPNPNKSRPSSPIPLRMPMKSSLNAYSPHRGTVNAGANSGWMHQGIVIPTDTLAPTPTGHWHIDIAIMSFAPSTQTGRSTRLFANSLQVTSWPVIDQAQKPIPRRSTC